MAKYCIWGSVPRYGSRDEIVGEQHFKEVCATRLQSAKKKLRALQRQGHEDLHFTLCKGANYCGSARKPHKGPVRRKRKGKPTTAKQRRAVNRARRQPDYIPF